MIKHKIKAAIASKYHSYSIRKPRISANDSDIQILSKCSQQVQKRILTSEHTEKGEDIKTDSKK
uniref:Putative ovule protein n=1 Tax=Solanum chacoense TaxID=4108 RepID=A0A0V0GHU5_SOLCH